MSNKLSEVKEQRKIVRDKILMKHNEFLFEYAKEVLRGMNVDCENIESIDDLKKVVKKLPKEQRKEFVKELEKLDELEKESISNLEKNNKPHPFGKLVKAVTKGAAKGAGIAGIINTIAPGIVPTFCGFLVGKGFGSVLEKIGILSIGFLGSHSFNTTAVLGVSAAIGGAVGAGCAIVGGAKKMYGKYKENKGNSRNEGFER